MLKATSCSIVIEKNHNYLYLKQSSDKESINGNKVDIIDPITGFVDSVDVYSFGKKQKVSHKSVYERVIDTNKIQQIILVFLDESSLMNFYFLKLKTGFGKCCSYDLSAIQFLANQSSWDIEFHA